MAGAKIRVDGLWRCLCPSMDAGALRRSIDQPLALRTRPQLQCRAATAATERAQDRRAYGTRPQRDSDRKPGPVPIRKHGVKSPDSSPPHVARAPHLAALAAASPETLHEALREFRESDGNHRKIMAYVQQLLKCSGGEKTPFIYETLVKANCCTKGSADSVRELLKEMRNANRGGLSSATYHAALRVRLFALMRCTLFVLTLCVSCRLWRYTQTISRETASSRR